MQEGLQFVNGEALCYDKGVADWYRNRGYTVEEIQEEAYVEPPKTETKSTSPKRPSLKKNTKENISTGKSVEGTNENLPLENEQVEDADAEEKETDTLNHEQGSVSGDEDKKESV